MSCHTARRRAAVLLKDKKAVVLNVANRRSLGWAIARAMAEQGAQLAIGYQNERVEEEVRALAATLPEPPLVMQCDVLSDAGIQRTFDTIAQTWGCLDIMVHSLAYAPRETLTRPYIGTSREAFRVALEVSAYSLVALAQKARPLFISGGSIIALTYYGAEKVVPNYNVMGVAKAALEASVRYLAFDLGQENIRVNAISAGPVNTLAARGISGFIDMMRIHRERAPLQRNIKHQEVAHTAVFMASPMASGITGEVVHVDAGYNIMGM